MEARYFEKAGWKKVFLEELSHCGSVRKSAEAAGVPYGRIWDLKKKDKIFAEKIEEALEEAAALLEEEALRRALEGVEEKVFYKGEETGTKIKYSDSLLMAMLKAKRPEKYSFGKKSSKDLADPGELLEDVLKRTENK